MVLGLQTKRNRVEEIMQPGDEPGSVVAEGSTPTWIGDNFSSAIGAWVGVVFVVSPTIGRVDYMER